MGGISALLVVAFIQVVMGSVYIDAVGAPHNFTALLFSFSVPKNVSALVTFVYGGCDVRMHTPGTLRFDTVISVTPRSFIISTGFSCSIFQKATAAQRAGALGVLYTGKSDASEKVRAPVYGNDGTIQIPVVLLPANIRQQLLALRDANESGHELFVTLDNERTTISHVRFYLI